MTDRKFTCVACKSAVTKDDIEQSDLEFDGVLKATNQPEYTADADTDLVATVGTLDGYTPMLRNTGNQDVTGVKTILSQYGTSNLVFKGLVADVTLGTFQANIPRIAFVDKNNELIASLLTSIQSNGTGQLQVYIRNSDGTYKYVQLANGDVI